MGKLSIKLLKGDFSLFSLAFFLQYFLFFLSKAFSYKLFSLGLGLNKEYKNNTQDKSNSESTMCVHTLKTRKACRGLYGKIHLYISAMNVKALYILNIHVYICIKKRIM